MNFKKPPEEIELGQLVKWEEKLCYYQGYVLNENRSIGSSSVTISLKDFWTGEIKEILAGFRYELEIVNELPDSQAELKDDLNKLGF